MTIRQTLRNIQSHLDRGAITEPEAINYLVAHHEVGPGYARMVFHAHCIAPSALQRSIQPLHEWGNQVQRYADQARAYIYATDLNGGTPMEFVASNWSTAPTILSADDFDTVPLSEWMRGLGSERMRGLGEEEN